MAVATALNVISASADGDLIAGRSLCITGIKLVQSGGSAAHFRLRQTDVSGTVVYEAKAAVGAVDWCDAEIKGGADIYVEIVAGAGTIYLYSE